MKMNINHFAFIILFFIGCLSLINQINCSNNNTSTMLILATSSSSINNYFKRRLSRHFITKNNNFTDDNITSLTNRIRILDTSYNYNAMKYLPTFTKTQIKVIITVVIIISFIMFIIAIFRFKNACRNQETDNLQTEIMRNRTLQYNEPSSRRGSVGYYTRKYSRTTSIRSDDQINNSLPTKRLSIPACDHSSKLAAVVVLPSSPVDTTDVTHHHHHHHHHVISSCDTSNIPNQQISITSTSSINIKPVVHNSSSPIGTNQINYLSSFNNFSCFHFVLFCFILSFITILSIHHQSRRLILCTVPPHILCRPNTVRYIFVVNVHDQRHRYSTRKRNNTKLSSPTLRKLCLPCITTRHHIRHHTNKKKPSKFNQHHIVTGVPHDNNGVESLQQFEVISRTYDTKSTIPVGHNNDYSYENNTNHSHEPHQHFEISFQNEKTEEKNNEISLVKIENKPISSEIVESELLLSSYTNELPRLTEDDVCDDRTPLLASELASTIKDSSNHTTRKYSFNALLPLVRPSNSHPLCSSLTSTNADGNNTSNGNGVNLKSHHRVSLTSALRRSSFAKQPQTFCSTVDSTNTTRAISSPTHPIESDSSDQTSILSNLSNCLNNNQDNNSSNIISTKKILYQKDFMQKIDRFRFIDDSASSTTTVTSPVESIEHVNNRQTTCNNLIKSTIEQIDDFVRTRYDTNDNDDVNSLINCLNSNILTNGSYSDLNILNNKSSTKTILRPQTFTPVNNKSFQVITPTLSGCQQHKYHQSTPITIPHSITSLPLSKQRNQIDINGYSRSMDFQTLTNKHELIRPVTIISTINETSSSSSTATLTSLRNSTSLEFDDNIKPSGVLVDDDFLPMSSPVDEHFWDMNIKNFNLLNNNNHNNNNKCFPNVGSSPDIEVKHFNLQQFSTLSETSCDEDDDDNDDDSTTSTDQLEAFSLYEHKADEIEKSIVLTKSNLPVQKILEEEIVDKPLSNPSINLIEQFNTNSSSVPISSLQSNDESLLEKFSLPSQIPISSDFLCDNIVSSNQHSQAISEEDDTQDSSTNDASEGDESADNGEIDLVQEFELSKKEQENKTNNLWTTINHDVYIIQDNDLLSAVITTPTIVNRNTQPTSIMKISNTKTSDSIDEQQQQSPQPQPQAQQQQQTLKPKVRFNLDPQYEREREWNKVNKLLGNSVEWTDEYEV
ncbi:unnamed protein product [Rotaria sp. Silwood2]|nr:unnamed protein product [Rotaria sp. Silwood2]CAF4266084.1 unnamed protein product [Rotaria sp. Silwood2]